MATGNVKLMHECSHEQLHMGLIGKEIIEQDKERTLKNVKREEKREKRDHMTKSSGHGKKY